MSMSFVRAAATAALWFACAATSAQTTIPYNGDTSYKLHPSFSVSDIVPYYADTSYYDYLRSTFSTSFRSPIRPAMRAVDWRSVLSTAPGFASRYRWCVGSRADMRQGPASARW